jgi:L-lactate permease
MIVLAILIVSWQLFKEVADVLGPAAPAVATYGVLVILGVIVLAAIVVYKMAVKK